MIRISTDEILTIAKESYNREVLLDLLKENQNIRLALLDGTKVCSVLCYTDIERDREVPGQVVQHGPEEFDEARKFFAQFEDREGRCIPVVDEQGQFLYVLYYEKNQIEDANVVSEFLDYDVNDENVDLDLLNRAKVYIFTEFEEYTYQISRVISKYFPERKMIFLDLKAAFFYENSDRVLVSNRLKDFYNRFPEEMDQPFMTIDSEKAFQHEFFKPFAKRYHSLELMTSTFWCCDRKHFGDKNPDKVFYLIKNPLEFGGIVDVIKFTLFRVAMVDKKEKEYIPVIDLSLPEPNNQFTHGKEINTWELFFKQVSNVPLEEVYESQNVIVSDNQLELFNTYVQEQAYYVDWKVLFQKYLKFNDETWKEIQRIYNQVLPDKSKRVLAVIGRGTDYRSNKGRWVPRPMEPQNLVNKAEELVDAWNCDQIFLATEDAEIYDLFMKSPLQERIVCVDQKRYTYQGDENRFLAEIQMEEPDEDYISGTQYLAVLYILSRCDCLMSSCSCGAQYAADGLKETAYDQQYIYFQ